MILWQNLRIKHFTNTGTRKKSMPIPVSGGFLPRLPHHKPVGYNIDHCTSKKKKTCRRNLSAAMRLLAMARVPNSFFSTCDTSCSVHIRFRNDWCRRYARDIDPSGSPDVFPRFICTSRCCYSRAVEYVLTDNTGANAFLFALPNGNLHKTYFCRKTKRYIVLNVYSNRVKRYILNCAKISAIC